MKSKKDSKRIKQKQEGKNAETDKFLSPLPKRQMNEGQGSILNLRDLSPFRTVYGSSQTPQNIHLSNTELTIIETPGNILSQFSSLEQFDGGHEAISGIINWECANDEESQNYEDDSQMVSISEGDSKMEESKNWGSENRKTEEKISNSNDRTAEPKEKRIDNLKKTSQVSTETISSTKKVTCNCKKTKCLKLYCDCFRLNQTCDGCNCFGCHNLSEFEEQRNNSMLTLMQRNPEAFRPKIDEQHHAKGCNCKKSGCQKKYCECYQAGLKCGQNCKCQQCKNGNQHTHDRNEQNPEVLCIPPVQMGEPKDNEKQKESKPNRSIKEMKTIEWVD